MSVLTVPGEHPHQILPAAMKLAFRYHIQTMCRTLHCVDSLVIYMNNPTKTDGTSLLWDVNNNGMVSRRQCVFSRQFKLLLWTELHALTLTACTQSQSSPPMLKCSLNMCYKSFSLYRLSWENVWEKVATFVVAVHLSSPYPLLTTQQNV